MTGTLAADCFALPEAGPCMKKPPLERATAWFSVSCCVSIYRSTRAPLAPIAFSTSLTVTIEVSPGVVMARAPCAAP